MKPLTKPVPSPCIRNCCLDQNDICVGCYRSLDEILVWGESDNTQKLEIIASTADRKQEYIRKLKNNS